jgi:20S proteasome alpha/beta subunit
MTLIAAFRTKEGIALCADSQETVTCYNENDEPYELRAAVQKISPIKAGGYELAIAGSGTGPQIDGFIERVKRRFKGDTESASLDRCLLLMEQELANYYTDDLPTGANMDLFVAACCPSTKEYQLWVSNRHILTELEDVKVIGWDHPLYKVTASRMYRSDLSVTQAVLAAVYVLTIAEETTNYVKSPFSVAVVSETGICMEESQYVRDLQDRLKAFEEHTNYVLLACADTSLYSFTLEAGLKQFVRIATTLHEQQINAVVEQRWKKGGIAKVPPGILVEEGPTGIRMIRHDVHGIEEMSRRINESIRNSQRTKQPPNEEQD